ncbi:hypothetical protein P7C73_g1504, partial [Tremellales sp. Uapishka_1]
MPSMSIPSFLQTGGSPPRSPHVQPSLFNSYFPVGSNSPQSASYQKALQSHWTIRPTRRDVLLCLLTLSFSYLLFSSHLEPSNGNLLGPDGRPIPNVSSRLRIPGLSYLYGPSEDSCPAAKVISRETTFGESVKTYGLALGDNDIDELVPNHGGVPWDGGEEAAEDDEFLGAAHTTLLGHAPGWTIMDKLYVFNGSFYVVTSDERSAWPELRLMTSTGLPANNEPGNGEAREPKGNEIIFITPLRATQLWGPRVYKMKGMTWLFNDGQFIDHYYHFAAELLLGTWRTYASMDSYILPSGETNLPPPERIWFLHQSADEWLAFVRSDLGPEADETRRDNPRFNPTLMFALFPSISMLYPSDFGDLANSTSSSVPKAYILEKALLADRSAAFRGEWTGPTARTVASALHVGITSRWWWEPIRRQVLRFSGVSELVINRNLEGYGAIDPATINQPHLAGPDLAHLEPLAPPGDYAPVVTYISRQSSRRRLTPESHAELVAALEERSAKFGWELVIVEAEKMTKEEQFALAGRTTIMLGVHGNGLSHLLWMPATPRSAVIEMFFVGGFARDYQWTAHALGIRHFAIQHDVSFTAPNTPKVDYPEGFQGEKITVVGSVVADLIEDRLEGRLL